jgi:lipopolysaccharide transport system ATP-binding protein
MVHVERLGKCYQLRHQADGSGPRYTTLRDVIASSAAAPLQWLKGSRARQRTRENFWALRDVSFDVRQGEVVGIIGRNGAGKSTLLKILSRITEPTEGRVELGGRVASLLEVGTGFHPELTGRENIYLNGAILGMTRREIARKFDEIVAFAEVERFLDTAVKHYSSGMYVRLAFGVAAHLEPDVLIVDEVLAVGDAEFQRKSLGKMRDVSQGGRTVLFVSHNMAAVHALCSRAVWLDGGRVAADGNVADSVAKYLAQGTAKEGIAPDRAVHLGRSLELRRFAVTPNPVVSGAPVRFTLELLASEAARIGELAILIASAQEIRVAIVDLRERLPVVLEAGETWTISGEITRLPMVEGDYRLGLYAVAGDFSGNLHDLADLRVLARPAAFAHAPYPAMYRGVVELDAVVDQAGRP